MLPCKTQDFPYTFEWVNTNLSNIRVLLFLMKQVSRYSNKQINQNKIKRETVVALNKCLSSKFAYMLGFRNEGTISTLSNNTKVPVNELTELNR